MFVLGSKKLTQDALYAEIQTVKRRKPESAAWFAVEGVNLAQPGLWAAMIRHSTEEQAETSHTLAEYLEICARLATERRVIVPIEYVLYDAESGAHMERQAMMYLRNDLLRNRKIAGVFVPVQSRLVRDNIQLGIFEYWLERAGAAAVYGNTPSGTDSSSKAMRQITAIMDGIYRETLLANTKMGMRQRIQAGNVPSRTPYGLKRVTNGQKGRQGRSWYEFDGLRPGVELPADGLSLETEQEISSFFIPGSPAYYLAYCWHLLLWRGLSGAKIAEKLTAAGFPAPNGPAWRQNSITEMFHNTIYKGYAYYGASVLVENPDNARDDITAKKRKTLRRATPEEEWIKYFGPRLVSDAAWQLAQELIDGFRNHRGAAAPQFPALLRGVIYCPVCNARMTTQRIQVRNGRGVYFYYRCVKGNIEERWRCPNTHCYNVDTMDADALGAMKWLVTHPEYIARLVEQQAAHAPDTAREQFQHLTREREKAAGKIKKVQALVRDDIYTVEEAQAEIALLREQVTKLDAALNELGAAMAEAEAARHDWDAARRVFATQNAAALDNPEEFARFVRALGAYYIPEGEDAGWHIRYMRSPDGSGANLVTLHGSPSLTLQGYKSLYLPLPIENAA